jgi:hypothetical protein
MNHHVMLAMKIVDWILKVWKGVRAFIVVRDWIRFWRDFPEQMMRDLSRTVRAVFITSSAAVFVVIFFGVRRIAG